jgi:hypothetical protein
MQSQICALPLPLSFFLRLPLRGSKPYINIVAAEDGIVVANTGNITHIIAGRSIETPSTPNGCSFLFEISSVKTVVTRTSKPLKCDLKFIYGIHIYASRSIRALIKHFCLAVYLLNG